MSKMIVKGQKINDRYEIIRTIGEGGMANVYLGYDTILDRNVAIKVLRGDLSSDEKFVRRFQREALSASSLSHPNIVAMYDVGEDDGLYYIVMEYVEGKTLKQLLKRRGNLTLSEVIDIMLQLTDGMSHAHDSYIIHRDLKPQNIMIQDDGQIKITDFGIAMALNSTQLTQTNSVMGSVHYLPPEQAAGKGSTIKSDIYSMGIIFYELLTGSLPFKGESAVEIALKQMKDPLPDVHEMNKDIPQSIENIILRSTAKNPKNRYKDVKEMHNDLLTALNDDRIDEDPYTYQYSEHEVDDSTKVLKKISDVETTTIATPIIDDDVKKTNKWVKILSVLAGVIVVICAVIFFVVPAITGEPDVKVPDVSNLSVGKAEEKLKEKGFEVASKIEEVESEKVKEGLIVKTDPEAGRSIKKGTTITLYRSLGKEKYMIEDYTGKNYIEIQTRLQDNGIKVDVKKKDVDTSKEYDEQEIIEQSIEAGKELSKGDRITLYIPNITETYPDMLEQNWSREDAEDFATKYQLNITIKEEETTAYEEGKVIRQSRAAGSPIISGASITVTIAKKPVDKKPPVDNKEDDKQNDKTENKDQQTSSTDEKVN